MSNATTTRPATSGDSSAEPIRSRSSGAVRRIASLARAEAILLRRSPTALLTALVMPVALVLLMRASVAPEDGGPPVAALVVKSLVGSTLILAVYHNLVTALVARREDLVLKRLRSGELRDLEILAGTSAPAVAIAWGQIAVGTIAAVTVFGMPVPVNPALVLVAIVLGTAVFVLLAAASTALARTAETAQMATTPVLLASVLLSDLMVPLDQLPEPLQHVGQLLPLTPVVGLVRLGLTGTTADGATLSTGGTFAAAAVPALLLAGWVVVSALAARRSFRWEPRR